MEPEETLQTPQHSAQETATAAPSSTQAAEATAQDTSAATAPPQETASAAEAPQPLNIAFEPEAATESPVPAQEDAPAPAGEADENPAAETPAGNGAKSSLQQWWESAAFEGKEHTSLSQDGHLVLNASGSMPSRNLAHLKAENADATVKALKEKFAEVEGRMGELGEEWDKAEDKNKLLSKTSRMYDYMQGAAALGDYAPLYARLNEWRGALGQLEEDAHTAKEALVKKAEAIAASNDWKEGAGKLRDLSDQWKSLGSIDKGRNDALWDRLEAARSSFNQRKREHSDEIEKEHMRNLDLKMELVDKAEALAASEEWKKTTELFKDLMEEWKKTGRTVAEKNESLWQRFISAKNAFYDRKRRHYEEIQQEQEGNYAVKLALVEKAESLSESTDWNATTNTYATLMDEWKASGRVGTDRGEELWQRMSKAKDIFFNAKRQHFETMRVNLDDNLAQKMALVKRAGQLKHSTQWREATDEFAELMEEWKRIGPVPRERTEKIWQQFSAARRAFFDNKDADRDRRKSQMVKQQAARLQQTRDFLKTLKEELKDDEERIAEFTEGVKNTGTGKKELELKAHLEKLIAQGTPSIERKQKKIQEVEEQLAQLEREEANKQRDRRNNERRESAPQQPRSATVAEAPQPEQSAKPDQAAAEPAQAEKPEPVADNVEQAATPAPQEVNEPTAAAGPAAMQERTHEEVDSIPATAGGADETATAVEGDTPTDQDAPQA